MKSLNETIRIRVDDVRFKATVFCPIVEARQKKSEYNVEGGKSNIREVKVFHAEL